MGAGPRVKLTLNKVDFSQEDLNPAAAVPAAIPWPRPSSSWITTVPLRSRP